MLFNDSHQNCNHPTNNRGTSKPQGKIFIYPSFSFRYSNNFKSESSGLSYTSLSTVSPWEHHLLSCPWPPARGRLGRWSPGSSRPVCSSGHRPAAPSLTPLGPPHCHDHWTHCNQSDVDPARRYDTSLKMGITSNTTVTWASSRLESSTNRLLVQ